MDSYPLGRDVLKLKFEREAGIKMGELYDFIEEELRYHPERRGTHVSIKNFETEEYEDDLCFLTTKCEVRNGEVCRPAQLRVQRAYSGSE